MEFSVKIPLEIDSEKAEKQIDELENKLSDKKRGPGRPRKIPVSTEGTDNVKKDFENIGKEAESTASKAKSSFGGLFDSLKQGIGIGAGLSVVTTGLNSIAGAAKQAFESYKQFDSQIQNIATLGITKDLGELKEVINEISKTTVDDASVLAGAFYQAQSAGIKGTTQELGKFVQTASKVATAGGSDAETAVDALTTVVNAFGVSASEADKISDQFFGTIKAGKTSFPELASSLSNVAGAAASAGISFGEVGAGIATLTAQGIPTAQATTKLRSAIVALQKPNAETTKLFKQMGLSVGDVAEILKKPVEEGGGLTNFLNDLQKEAAKSGKSFTQLFSSVEAGSAALALTGANAELAFGNLEAVINDSAGSAEFAYEQASSSIENQLGLIAGSIQATFNSLFIKLEPLVKGFLSGFGVAFDFVAEILSEVGSIVGDVLQPVFDTFNVIIDEVTATFKELFGETSSGVNILGVVKDVIVTLIQVALVPIRIVLSAVAKIIQTTVKYYYELVRVVISVTKSIVEFVENNQILNAVFTSIGSAISFVIDKLKTLLSSLGLWSDKTKTATKETDKQADSFDNLAIATDGVGDGLGEATEKVNELGGAVKKVTASELVEQLAKLKIAGKENTAEFANLSARIIKLNAEETLFANTLKSLNEEFGIGVKATDNYSKSLSKISDETEKLNLELDKSKITALAGGLEEEIKSVERQIKNFDKIDISEIFVGDGGIVGNLTEQLFGFDVSATIDTNLIQKQSDELIALLKEQNSKKEALLKQNLENERQIKELDFEAQKKQRERSFNEEITNKGLTQKEIENLTTEFQNNERLKKQIFENDLLNDEQKLNAKLIDNKLLLNDDIAKINDEGLKQQKEAEQKRLELFNNISKTTESIFTGLGNALIDGQKSIKKLLLTSALDILDSFVPIWTAQILGSSLATGGAAGLIQAGLLTGLLKAAISVAKSQIGGLQEGGLVGTTHKPKGNRDTQLRWLDPQEIVLNREAVNKFGASNLLELNKGRVPQVFINNDSLATEMRKTKMVETEIKLNIRDYSGKFKIERVYR
jgi:TP901 family phage tail tape measure protein